MLNARASLALLALAAASYAAPGQVSVTIQNGKPQKAVIGLPFSADQTVRMVQHLANGTPLAHQMSGHVYRFADGLQRFDGQFTSSDPANPEPITLAYILDPSNHTYTLLNSRLKTATITHLPENATVSVAFLPLPRAAGAAQQLKPENITASDLGKRTQDMMPLLGKRVSSTIPAGKIGNEQPILSSVDMWVAPQLKIVVNEVTQDPLTGERTFNLTNIRSEEPDPTLFQIPDGYKVTDRPTPSPPNQSAPTTPDLKPK